MKSCWRCLADLLRQESQWRFIWASYYNGQTEVSLNLPSGLGGSTPKPTIKTTTTFLYVPETSFSPCTSSSKQELAQLLERFQGSKRFLELQWIHFTDSGGQPQLHEVFPAFIGNTMDIIFCYEAFWRVGWRSSGQYYKESGDWYSKPYHDALSNEQILVLCWNRLVGSSIGEGKHSKLL